MAEYKMPSSLKVLFVGGPFDDEFRHIPYAKLRTTVEIEDSDGYHYFYDFKRHDDIGDREFPMYVWNGRKVLGSGS
jgi:hypothetical protein